MKIASTLVALTICAQAWAFQAAPEESLVDKIKLQLIYRCYDEADCVPLGERLLRLGDKGAICNILLDLAVEYKNAKLRTPENSYRSRSVAALGVFGEKRAIPLLVEIIKSDLYDEDLKIITVQSIGAIDPEGNKDLLLDLLKNSASMSIRGEAARGLSHIRDQSIVFELDVAASRESGPWARRSIQEMADTLRLHLSSPVDKKP